MNDMQRYSSLVVKTFRQRAIRTAMLIDDKFPTYADLITRTQIDPNLYQNDKARLVFKTFKDNKIPCDIENNPDNLSADSFEHVRKSDLVVLDFHLRQENDSFDSIKVLSQLSSSKHFNLVVLYTAAEELDRVWLEIAVCLRGGWKSSDSFFSDDPSTQEIWDELSGDDQLPEPTEEYLRAYLLGSDLRDERKAWVEFFKEKSITGASLGRCVEALVHRYVLKKYGDRRMAPILSQKTSCLNGRCERGRPLWILSGSVFLAITSKRKEGEPERAHQDPEGILKCLDEALIDWQPNVLRIIISELQNILEQEPLPYNDTLLEDAVTQAGWIYHVLKQASASATDDIYLSQALNELYERLFGAIQSNILSSQILRDFGSEAFKHLTKDAAISEKSESQLVDLAIELAKLTGAKPEHGTVLHSLNKYLSSEAFSGNHVTTGTIFKHSVEDEWWVCVSPNCDMVPRKPADALNWSNRMHPMLPMLALRLENSKAAALNQAEQGRMVFINFDKRALFFKAFEENTRQPRPHVFLLCEGGRIQVARGESLATFSAHHIVRETAEDTPKFEKNSFIAVAQLRPAYANRLLQQTGNHTSRIGVDFVNFGQPRN